VSGLWQTFKGGGGAELVSLLSLSSRYPLLPSLFFYSLFSLALSLVASLVIPLSSLFALSSPLVSLCRSVSVSLSPSLSRSWHLQLVPAVGTYSWHLLLADAADAYDWHLQLAVESGTYGWYLQLAPTDLRWAPETGTCSWHSQLSSFPAIPTGTEWFAGRLVCWGAGWMTAWLASWRAGRAAGGLAGKLAGELVGWLRWVTVGPTGCLLVWLGNWLTA
jgi:hypothetical protein